MWFERAVFFTPTPPSRLVVMYPYGVSRTLRLTPNPRVLGPMRHVVARQRKSPATVLLSAAEETTDMVRGGGLGVSRQIACVWCGRLISRISLIRIFAKSNFEFRDGLEVNKSLAVLSVDTYFEVLHCR